MQVRELITENAPNDQQARLGLAAAYLEVGRRADAIAQIQLIIDQNPDFAKQGQYYIDEIKAGRNP